MLAHSDPSASRAAGLIKPGSTHDPVASRLCRACDTTVCHLKPPGSASGYSRSSTIRPIAVMLNVPIGVNLAVLPSTQTEQTLTRVRRDRHQHRHRHHPRHRLSRDRPTAGTHIATTQTAPTAPHHTVTGRAPPLPAGP